MRKVGWLKRELEKFPDDADCYAYEGEVVGIVINKTENGKWVQGVIYCSESDDSDRISDLLP